MKEKISQEHQHETFVQQQNYQLVDKHEHLLDHQRMNLIFDRFPLKLLHVEHDFDDKVYRSIMER
jgi:hypothetical protein